MSQIVEVNATSIHVERVGSGPACLVMHGGLGIDHQLYRTLDPLAARLELVFYDHRGNGRSGRPSPSTITMEQLADDARTLATTLGHDRCLVFGHSYGGFVAQETALRHPDLVAGLILFDTTAGQLGTTESADDYQGPPPPPEFLEMVSRPPHTDEEYRAAMTALLRFYLHRAEPSDLGDWLDRTVFDAATMRRGFQVLANWSSADRLDQIAVPTFVGNGRHDPVTSVPQATRIANRVPDAEVHVFEQSGHLPWIDEPGACFAALHAWLDRTMT